jgi:DNA-binding transcriptional MerR regulator
LKLFNSVFYKKEVSEKFEAGLKATNPNYLLFEDLRSQGGVNDAFQSSGTNYRLYENADSLKKLETDLLLGRDKKIQRIKELKDKVDAENRKITKKLAENKKTALDVVKIADEVLEKKKEALKTYKLEDGIDKIGKDQGEIALRKIEKLILEIRYLENGGDARIACAYENDTANHCNGLVGTDTVPDGNLDNKFKD